MKKIDFSKRKFIRAFKRFSKERNDGSARENWDRIIAGHYNLTPEENLARLVWKGIDAQTKEYEQEVDEILGN